MSIRFISVLIKWVCHKFNWHCNLFLLKLQTLNNHQPTKSPSLRPTTAVVSLIIETQSSNFIIYLDISHNICFHYQLQPTRIPTPLPTNTPSKAPSLRPTSKPTPSVRECPFELCFLSTLVQPLWIYYTWCMLLMTHVCCLQHIPSYSQQRIQHLNRARKGQSYAEIKTFAIECVNN